MNSKQLYYKVKKGSFDGRINVPSSKSHANRALILAAISQHDILLTNIPPSTDVLTMLSCFEQIGLKIIKSNEGIWIKGDFPACEQENGKPLILKTGDGGTTNRFLIPLLALGKREYIIEPTGHMRSRPMGTLFDSLQDLGVEVIRSKKIWGKIRGPISTDKKEVYVDASVSSQFASGIYLALSNSDVVVKPKDMDGSESYFELTCEIESIFKKMHNAENEYQIPVDFSSISYPIALSLFDKGIEVLNCSKVDTLQPDSRFLEIIKSIGGDYDFQEGHLKIHAPKTIKAQDIDCKEFPDLVPTLAFCFSYAKGETVLRNLRSLRVKECDRINEIIKILNLFKIENYVDEDDNIHIKGQQFPSFNEEISVFPPKDHRMVMLSYLFLRINNGGRLHNYSYVDKSFSNFYQVMEHRL